MARKVRHSALESRSARLKLKVRRKPYSGPSLSRGIMLLYRRNKTNGSWVIKVSDGHGGYWTKAIGQSDDFDTSDGQRVLDFYQAQDAGKKLARGEDGVADSAPITIDGALLAYEIDLKARNANVYNAKRPRKHLTPALLTTPVQLLGSGELQKWRNSLLGKIAPATINRICNALCAALELAAQHDRLKRIKNRDAWEVGLAALPDAQEARNVVISDNKVCAFVATAYARDHQLGLLVDVLAITGTRPSQAIRLRVEDLHNDPVKPFLRMPKSGKGGGRNRSQRKVERYNVPITPALAVKLQQAAKGRAGAAPLLVRSNGNPWNEDPSQDYRTDMAAIVTAIGLDPNLVSVYALRHSSIVRALLRNVPVRLTAATHDTSISQIERNYSRFITEHADDFARVALLQHDEPTADNVVVLPGADHG